MLRCRSAAQKALHLDESGSVAGRAHRRLQAPGAVRARRRRDLHGHARHRAARADHEADLVSVPFKWYPGARVLTQAFLWRLLDLEEADGQPIDVVVATKFPSYVVRHPNKRVWLVHQFRQAYELDRTELGQFGESGEDRARAPQGAGARPRALGEAARLFATSGNVAAGSRALDRSQGGGDAAPRRSSSTTAARRSTASCSR